MNKHPVQEGVAILIGMLHATETGISFDRLGLWLVCAFILTYFISWYMLLISAVVKTNARHYVKMLKYLYTAIIFVPFLSY